VDLLADRAARLEARLDPGGVKARKERARRCEQRVEARREASGNACLSGREMDTADVIASKAFIDALAARLRRGGLPGSLGAPRVLALADLTQGVIAQAAPPATPIARDSRDHLRAEEQYSPSRRLSHLVRARTATCDAPGCQNLAANADLGHTVPWPDGPTDQGNLAPRCRTHHRAKQAPDWTVEQLAPGVTRWILPSGRTHVTTPTRYDS
jgi:hypothetical protein